MLIIKSKNSIFDLTCLFWGERMLTNLFVRHCPVMDTSDVCGQKASSLLAEAQEVDCIINNASKRRKPAPIKNIHICLSANVAINKNVALLYDLADKNRRIHGYLIRAPPSCRT